MIVAREVCLAIFRPPTSASCVVLISQLGPVFPPLWLADRWISAFYKPFADLDHKIDRQRCGYGSMGLGSSLS